MSTERMAIKNLKPGKFCVIDGEPCRVVSCVKSKPGKHGGAKARVDAVGIFDNRKRSIVKPASTDIEVPIVEKKTAQVVALSGNNAQIMDMETYETFDAEIPEELKGKIDAGVEVIYWVILGRKMLVSLK